MTLVGQSVSIEFHRNLFEVPGLILSLSIHDSFMFKFEKFRMAKKNTHAKFELRSAETRTPSVRLGNGRNLSWQMPSATFRPRFKLCFTFQVDPLQISSA